MKPGSLSLRKSLHGANKDTKMFGAVYSIALVPIHERQKRDTSKNGISMVNVCSSVHVYKPCLTGVYIRYDHRYVCWRRAISHVTFINSFLNV